MDSNGRRDASMSPIQEFYNNQCILLTGATGFVGKVVVEKLLRSCSGIKQIYLLIREKHGRTIEDRMTTLLNTPVFDEIRRIQNNNGGKLFEKLVPVRGDISEPGLGLSCESTQLLCREVNVVFHIAAYVRFDEDMKTAMNNNVYATQKVMDLIKTMNHLKAFVYVSTAYSNCVFNEIQEMVYCYRIELSSIYPKLLPTHIDDNIVLHEFTRKWPNNYTATKALAEMVVEDNCKTISAAILRPSVVLSSWEEPFAGWIDSFTGPTQLLTASALGLFHTIHIPSGAICESVPVDMLASAIIAAAWDVSTMEPTVATPRVYNFVTGKDNRLKWEEFLYKCVQSARRSPSIKTIWYPFFAFCNTRLTYVLTDFFLELIPSLLMDIPTLFLKGKHRNLDRYLCRKKNISRVEYFAHNNWKFEEKNIRKLVDRMNAEDRQTFHFDVNDIKWEQLVTDYILGIRRHLLKETDETIPYCREHLNRLYILHYTLISAIIISIIFSIVLFFVL